MEQTQTTTAPTKTVEGHFGPKQITRDEFVKRWTDHFGQVWTLANDIEEFEELTAMRERIAQMAGERWDRIK